MIWLLANIRNIGILLALLAIPAAYMIGTYKGKLECQNTQRIKQLEHTVEVKKTHEKIERKIPYSSDRSSKFEWLRLNQYQ
jgi:hypothetical protein